MSLKILFFPFALVMTLVVILAYIKPTVATILVMRTEMETLSSNLDQVKNRSGNIKAVIASFRNEENAAKAMEAYFPDTLDQDHVIDSFNFLSRQSGVSLTSITLSKESVQPTSVATEEQATSSVVFAAGTATDGTTDQTLLVPEYPSPVKYSAKVSVTGTYVGIQNFMESVYGIDRESVINSFVIKKKVEEKSDGKKSESNVDILTADMDIAFRYYTAPMTVRNAYLLDIFGKTSMDFSVFDAIRSKTDLPEIEKTTNGRENPFL